MDGLVVVDADTLDGNQHSHDVRILGHLAGNQGKELAQSDGDTKYNGLGGKEHGMQSVYVV